jgi:hypothetical protein
VERLIGAVRRECLDHIVVLGKRYLRRTLTAYFAYYHRARTHLSLDKDAPDVRPVERPEAAGSCRFAKSVDSIIDTCVARHSPWVDPLIRTSRPVPFSLPASIHRRLRFVLPVPQPIASVPRRVPSAARNGSQPGERDVGLIA